jgi:hypothetical protein
VEAAHFEHPREQAPPGEGQCQQNEIEGHLAQRRSRESSRDDVRDQRRLEQDEPRRGGAEDRVEDEQVTYGPGAAHEPLVEDAHDQLAGDPLRAIGVTIRTTVITAGV